MLRWTLWSLWEDRLVALASACGIALALMLALYLDAVARGEADQIVAFPEHAPADVWVLQKGVEDLHMARSVLSDLAIAEVAEVRGVAGVTPLVYRDVRIGRPGVERVGYMVGIPPGLEELEPWDMASGRDDPGFGEVVAPAAMLASKGLKLGDRLLITGRELTVVGASRGTFSMANPLFYTSEAQARELFDRPDGANALLVHAAPSQSPTLLAKRIEQSVDNVRATTRGQLIDNDRGLGLQMAGAVVHLMAVVAAVVSALILTFTILVFVDNRRRELAVARALGAGRGALAAAAVVQSALIALAGCLLAALAVPLLGALLTRYVPQVAVHFSMRALALFAAGTTALAMLAALPPVWRILHIDPALAFKA